LLSRNKVCFDSDPRLEEINKTGRLLLQAASLAVCKAAAKWSVVAVAVLVAVAVDAESHFQFFELLDILLVG